MRNLVSLSLVIILIFSAGGIVMGKTIPDSIQKMIDDGEYKAAQAALEKEAQKEGLTEKQKKALLFESERLNRIPYDFRLTEEDVLQRLQESIPDATMDDVTSWTKTGALESRLIEGKRLYFTRSVSNLFLLNRGAAARRKAKPKEDDSPVSEQGEIKDLRIHAKNALEARKNSKTPTVEPQRFKIEYTLSVKPGEVPEGKIIRCWLPYPKEVPTQTDIVLLDSYPGNPLIAPNEKDQRTVYMERPAEKDKPTTFSITFQYTAWAFVQPIDPAQIKPYDTKKEVYNDFTMERPPHIVFTPEIKKLAKEICGDEQNPYLKAKKIFAWVDANIPWSGAIEYSIVPNLSMRALTRRTGDCGMQGLLFITLCRYSGIPARWQSGWSLKPGAVNLHDWTQFYVEPYGWLYADPSNGLMKSDDEDVRWYNFGNFDRYRLIVNSNYGMELEPKKTHFRSETVDFQRGEVEWEGGNLYFDKWTYKMKVTPPQFGKIKKMAIGE